MKLIEPFSQVDAAILYSLIFKKITSLERRISELTRIHRNVDVSRERTAIEFWHILHTGLDSVIPYVPVERKADELDHIARRNLFIHIHKCCANRERREGHRDDGRRVDFCLTTGERCNCTNCPEASRV